MTINFNVYGTPMGKQRPRIYSIRGHAHAYTPKETILYENKVANEYRKVAKDFCFNRDDFIRVAISANFQLNQSDYGKKGLNKSGREKMENQYCGKKPDIDNLVKSILDGLNGVAYYDDSQVVSIQAFKKWTTERSFVYIKIEKINKDISTSST